MVRSKTILHISREVDTEKLIEPIFHTKKGRAISGPARTVLTIKGQLRTVARIAVLVLAMDQVTPGLPG